MECLGFCELESIGYTLLYIITKEIIHAHGENINVVSTEGVGTEFIFSLMKSEKSNEE